MKTNMRPYSFAVFIARRSGTRPPRDPAIARRGQERFVRDLQALAEDPRLSTTPEYALAQQALRRCLHLASEMFRIAAEAPVACAITGRSVVETALVACFLMLNDEEGGVAGLMKRQRAYSRRLREHFLEGNTLAALALLPNASFITEPLRSEFNDAKQAPDLKRICEVLDEKPPFEGGLATQIYNETYTLLSNRYVHATPQSIGRYREPPVSGRAKSARRFEVPADFPDDALIHAVLPAVGALASCLAGALGEPIDYFNQWLREANTVDGYDWSGSLARMVAVEGLAELAHLPTVDALNAVGVTTRILATTDPVRFSGPDEQLLLVTEIIDRARTALPKRLKHRWFHILFTHRLLVRHHSSTAADRSAFLSQGHAADDPQALLAALALIYAGLWPDEPDVTARYLAEFDDTAPHEAGALNRLLSSPPPRLAFRAFRERWREQVSRMN